MWLTLILNGLKDVIYNASKWNKDYKSKSIQDINAIFAEKAKKSVPHVLDVSLRV